MIIFLATMAAMGGVFVEMGRMLRKPKYRGVIIWMLLSILLASAFYHYAEGWSWLDSFYFSVITLSTVGYGDFSPTMPLTKIFTMVYIILGLSFFASFASMLAKERLEHKQEKAEEKKQKEVGA